MVHVSLKVYDVLGREAAVLVDEPQEPGTYTIEFSAKEGKRDLSSGVYFYSLKAGDFFSTKKFVLIK